jgi:hypothetical protein
MRTNTPLAALLLLLAPLGFTQEPNERSPPAFGGGWWQELGPLREAAGRRGLIR